MVIILSLLTNQLQSNGRLLIIKGREVALVHVLGADERLALVRSCVRARSLLGGKTRLKGMITEIVLPVKPRAH